MADIVERVQRVVVEVGQQELNSLLIEPATDAGYINFVPTRIHTRALPNGKFSITFEQVGQDEID